MPDVPKDLAKRIASEITAWIDELDDLRRDPKVRQYLYLEQRVGQTDASMAKALAPPPWRRDRLGIPLNELSALKREDLEDVVVLHSPVPKRGG